jgi:hypothetical protein
MSETTNNGGATVVAGVSPAIEREKLSKKAITADHEVDRDLRARC